MNKSQVSAILARDPLAVTKAIVLLFSFQTVGERSTSSTVEDNGVGFNAAHAKDASYWARWVLRVGPNTPSHIVADRVRHYLTGDNCRQYRTLSGRFLDKARQVAAVYWRQLAKAADTKRNPPTKEYKLYGQDELCTAITQWDRFQQFPGVTQGL